MHRPQALETWIHPSHHRWWNPVHHGSQPRNIGHLVRHVEVIIDGVEVSDIVIREIHVLCALSEREIGDDIACGSFEGQARVPWVPGFCSRIESLQDGV